MPSDQDCAAAPNGRTSASPNPGRPVVNHLSRLHSGPAFGTWFRCNYGSSGLSRKARTFHGHAHNDHGTRGSTTVSPKCLETARTSKKYRLRSGSAVHVGVHPGTLSTDRNSTQCLYGLPPTD